MRKAKRDMLGYIDASIEYANLQTRHVFLGIIPLFHTFGVTAMLLAPIQLGATVVYIARFSPVATLKALREHKASILFGTHSMIAAIARLKDAKPEALAHIYAIITGDYEVNKSDYHDGQKPITRGTKILIPTNKLNRAQEDGGNPSGQGVVFISPTGEVLCYLGPTLS